eukprot:TRINITY_DN306_c0_g1_i1.p2 TRINITY_DN306_c0_g1~~TRINITY_DN306_c0_g1_i1.p2  ORF type:complete len:446 (-),score=246.88 TRINITY_DN306_c0_g1_i1:114-1430(-)
MSKTQDAAKNIENDEELVEYDDDFNYTAADAPVPSADASSNKKTFDGGVTTLHSSSFKDLMLKPELLRAVADCGFEHPSIVQHECIPQAVLGTDVLCQAKSGMGKTAVFVFAVLQQIEISVPSKVSTIILCHARELAYQIRAEFDRFKKYLPQIKTQVIYGGVPITEQRDILKGENCPHVIIGTPGRVLGLIKEKSLDLSNVKHFVLDECDRMLAELSMRRDVQEIFKSTPLSKQVMMFSATLSEDIRPVCKRFMRNPLEIYINDGAKLTLHGLQQYFAELEEKDKNKKLVDLLDSLDFNQLVIFVKSVSRANVLNKLLQECNFPSMCIHSGLKQEERIDRYKKFKEFQARIMVATDIFGRGIDMERVNVVINYDMTDSPDTYLHRVGRAGRFGTKGLAISFISSEDDANTLNSVQERFVVEIKSLPDEIDSSSYMTA